MRLLLTLKRSALVHLSRVGAVRGPSNAPPALRDPLPRPLLPPRTHLVAHTARGPELAVLNERIPLSPPVAWHRDDPRLASRSELLDLHYMNLHYMEYLEGVDDAVFAGLTADWFEHNPPYRAGFWRDSWNSYALSIRTVVWLQQVALRGDGFAEGLRERLARSVAQQTRFLTRNLETDLGGNHLIKNIKALLWAGRCFGGDEASGWKRRGERLLLRELDEQVLEDGVHYERSPAYHVQVFADLLECFQVLDEGPVRDALAARLDAMAQALADLTHPDGSISLFNDGGLEMAYEPAACLAAYERLTGRRVRARPVFDLPAAGYFGARSGGSYLLADCGAIAPDFLPAHGHGDILAFEWTVSGQRIIVDAGVCQYQPGPWREYARATTSHNTVTLDDESQCEFWSSFRVGRRARVTLERYEAGSDGFELLGRHDGYAHLAGRPIHRRRLAVGPRRVEVEDEIQGGAGQRAVARLLCHPDCSVEPVDGGLRIRRGDVTVALHTEARLEVRAAWWSPNFGVAHETRQVTLDYGAAPCQAVFALTEVREPGSAQARSQPGTRPDSRRAAQRLETAER